MSVSAFFNQRGDIDSNLGGHFELVLQGSCKSLGFEVVINIEKLTYWTLSGAFQWGCEPVPTVPAIFYVSFGGLTDQCLG